jgi:threonine/homoserine/homoserine lactone efflux protein
MGLVRVEDDHLARRAPLRGAAVVEGLDAQVGDADRVGVVPVTAEGPPHEASVQERDPPAGLVRPKPLPGPARTFKTTGRLRRKVRGHVAVLARRPGAGGSMLERPIAFLVFSVVMAGTPGPSNVLLTATGAAVGVRRGLPALFGVAAGMASMMFVTGAGLGGLVRVHPRAFAGVRWLGAAALCWLAWRIANAGGTAAAGNARPTGFLGAAAFQWVNPKAWLACASAAATFIDGSAGHPLSQAAALASLFVAACLPSCLPWLAFGAVLHGALRSPRASRIFHVAMALLLLATVVVVVG